MSAILAWLDFAKCIFQTTMQENNISDEFQWPLVESNASAVASTFRLMISIIALSRELTSTLLDIPQIVCLPYLHSLTLLNAYSKPL